MKERLAQEFLSTRLIYKFLEGLAVGIDSHLSTTQVHLQIISYASIYEAVIHYILFERLLKNITIQSLLIVTVPKRISIPENKRIQLQDNLVHDGKIIIPMYEGNKKRDVTKIRFDEKAECAVKLGLIDEKLKNELIEFYSVRNAIHIHAEIKKNIDYHLELSKKSYRRMKPFIEQIKINLPRLLDEQEALVY